MPHLSTRSVPLPPLASASAPFSGRLGLLWLAVLALGVFLRSFHFGVGRSLWLDEAMLAHNFMQRSYAGLLQPLIYDQVAPAGYLLLQRLCVDLFGRSDAVLRLWSLLSSLAALVLMAPLAARFGRGLAPLTAFGLFALSGQLIYYASEVKQYSGDVLASVVLLTFGVRCLGPGAGRRPIWLLGAAALPLLALSHTSIFVLAGVLGCLLLDLIVTRAPERRRWFDFAAVSCICVAVFLTIYLLTMRRFTGVSTLEEFWNEGLLPRPVLEHLDWFWEAGRRLLFNPGGWNWSLAPLMLMVMLCGAIALLRRDWRLALMVLTPLLLALIAACLRIYPMRGRVMLYALPMIYLLIGEALEAVRAVLDRRQRAVAWGVAAVLVAGVFAYPAATAVVNLRKPPLVQHIRPLMEVIRARRQPGDHVYVFHRADVAFSYYAPAVGFSAADYVQGRSFGTAWERYAEEAAAQPKAPRTWLLVSHLVPRNRNSLREILKQLRAGGPRETRIVSGESELYLLDYTAAARTSTTAAGPWP